MSAFSRMSEAMAYRIAAGCLRHLDGLGVSTEAQRTADSIAAAVQYAYRLALRDAAREVQAEQDHIKHTSHVDGFGMGCRLMEEGCAHALARIHALEMASETSARSAPKDSRDPPPETA